MNFAHTRGSTDQFVHFIEKSEPTERNVEWAMRQYNVDSSKPSRLSFYLFNSGPSPGKGAGAYMQHQLSANDRTPVEIGRWLFLVGQGECWIKECDDSTGAIFYKQSIQSQRTGGDKYYNPPEWKVRPHNGGGRIAIGGSINKTAFHGSVAHVALWNRLLAVNEVEQIWSAGLVDLA